MNPESTKTDKHSVTFDGRIDLAGPADVAYGDAVTFSGTGRVSRFSVADVYGKTHVTTTVEVEAVSGIAAVALPPADEPVPATLLVDLAAVPAPKRFAWLRAGITVPRWALLVAGILFLLSLTACGSPTEATPRPGPVPLPTTVHATLCGQFKAKAEDATRSQAARDAARAEYDARCGDVTP
jgi:hypothetical protein